MANVIAETYFANSGNSCLNLQSIHRSLWTACLLNTHSSPRRKRCAFSCVYLRDGGYTAHAQKETAAHVTTKLEGRTLSDPYPVERRVKHLFPASFVLIMDPLLTKLQSSGYGLSIKNFYCGAFMHADDIRTLATSPDSLKMQVTLVNFL